MAGGKERWLAHWRRERSSSAAGGAVARTILTAPDFSGLGPRSATAGRPRRPRAPPSCLLNDGGAITDGGALGEGAGLGGERKGRAKMPTSP
eukprot:9112106-Alexandrium_andersonii.AAC.1